MRRDRTPGLVVGAASSRSDTSRRVGRLPGVPVTTARPGVPGAPWGRVVAPRLPLSRGRPWPPAPREPRPPAGPHRVVDVPSVPARRRRAGGGRRRACGTRRRGRRRTSRRYPAPHLVASCRLPMTPAPHTRAAAIPSAGGRRKATHPLAAAARCATAATTVPPCARPATCSWRRTASPFRAAHPSLRRAEHPTRRGGRRWLRVRQVQ